jgi:hypothetical protein
MNEKKSFCIFLIIDCSVCRLDDSFNDSNGYSCFNLNDEHIACTCPDLRYALDKPCRIFYIYLFDLISTNKKTFFRYMRSQRSSEDMW